ncbi:MAG TPA: DUF503 domain-containing protein [Aquifex aeolicus]|uniref:DUF503 domain-containing protein n=1 Tax=Aquifex aeolicus TaxID=63363 RepID=A0A7C5L8E7_AQUAO|nr:DUF503 domain-containing protein [Aquifex aeolicus]
MIVGVLRVELFIPEAGSLKSKRSEIRSIKERIRRSFNASVSEIDNQDLWQRGTLGIAVVGSSAPFVQETLDRITGFLEKNWAHLLLELSSEILHL